jgi:hypothetical protein
MGVSIIPDNGLTEARRPTRLISSVPVMRLPDGIPTVRQAGVRRGLLARLRYAVVAGGWLAQSVTAVGVGPSPLPARPPESAGPPEQAALLLPDLRTLEPSDLRLEGRSDGSRALRLANTVWNSGQGPLELRGETMAGTTHMRVIQVLHMEDGTTLERPVGHFIFHPTHDHWHLDDFAIYQLWTLSPRGELAEIVAASSKVSYCLIDTDPVRPHLPGFSPGRTYRGCGRLQQGLSVGWGDHYHAGLDGQTIELGELPDGLYALRSVANAEGLLFEADKTNNEAIVYLGLSGRNLMIVPPREVRREACLTTGVC